MPVVNCSIIKDNGWTHDYHTGDSAQGQFGSVIYVYMYYVGEEYQTHYEVAYIVADLSAIPAGSTINSAIFNFYGSFQTGGTVRVGRITQAWGNSISSWLQDSYVQTIVLPANNLQNGWKQLNITDTIRSIWNSGVNNGFSLNEGGRGLQYDGLTYYTRDSVNGVPYVTVDYTPPNQAPNPPTVTLSVGSPTNASQITVSWSLNDPDAGDYQTYYEVVGTSNNWASWNVISTGQVADGNARSRTVTVPEGTVQFGVRTWDKSGGVSGWGYSPAVLVDRTVPTIGSIDTPNARNAPNYNGTHYRIHAYNINGGASGYSYTQWYSVKENPDGTWVEGQWTNHGSGIKWNSGTENAYFDFPWPLRGDGRYRVRCWAYDGAGNGQYVDTFLIIDTVRPNDPNATATSIKANSVTITWNPFSDTAPSSGYASTEIFLGEWVNGAFVGGTPNVLNGGIANTGTHTQTGLKPNTTYRYTVTHHDLAGNESLYTYKTFTTNALPTVTSVSPSNGQAINARSPNITWTYSDPNGDAQGGYIVEIVNEAYSAAVRSTGWLDSSSKSLTYVDAFPSDGKFWIRVRVKDSKSDMMEGSGNGPDFNFYNVLVTVDTVAPTISSVSGTQYVKDNSSKTYWANGVTDDRSGINRVEVWITPPTGSAFYFGLATKDGSTNNWSTNFNLSSSNAEGTWYIDFFAFDNAGNQSPRGRCTLIHDRTAPTIASVQGYSYTNQTTGTRRVWAYGITDGLSEITSVVVGYKIAGSSTWESVNVTANKSGNDYYVDIPLSAQGEYDVNFRATDAAGNASEYAITKFFVDSQRANDPNPSAVWGTTTATISWGAISDPPPSSGYEKTLLYFGAWNGSVWVGRMVHPPTEYRNQNKTEQFITGLSPGTRYRYTVIYYDKAGNESSYTYREFVTKKKIGEDRVQGKTGIIVLPIYDPESGVLGSKAYRVSTSAGIGCFELVSNSDFNASPERISTPQGIKSISK